MTKPAPTVAIIGAGIIGLSCAWEMSKRGADVTVYEKSWPPRGASWAAAGMLAPAFEAAAEEGVHPRLYDLCKESAALWPTFASDLEAATGANLGFSSGPTLALAHDAAEVAKHEALIAGDASVKVLDAGAHNALSAIELLNDGWVDNRAALEALCQLIPKRAAPNESFFAKKYDHVLQANGWVNGLCDPVMGQLLSVEHPAAPITQTIRSGHCYIVPKPDRVVIGATSEMGIPIIETDDETIADLRRQAEALCPQLKDCREIERWAGLRPVTLDHAPAFAGNGEGMWAAVGHGRNGILLAPVTAQIMADMILENKVSDLAAAFHSQRLLDIETAADAISEFAMDAAR